MALPENAILPQQVEDNTGDGMSPKSPVFNDMSSLVNLMGLDGDPNLNIQEGNEKIAAAPILTGAANASLGQEAVQNEPNQQKSVFDLAGNQQNQNGSNNQQNQNNQQPQLTQEQIAEQERQQQAQNQQASTQTSQEQVVPQDIQTITTQFEAERNGYVQEIENLKLQNAALSKFNENPMEFLAKNMPGVIINKFNPEAYVATKMSEKYGEDFEFVPTDAFKPNTDSYRYRKDLEAFEAEAAGYVNGAKNTTSAEEAEQQRLQQEAQGILTEKITAIKTKYGLDDVAFNSKIWQPLTALKDQDRLDILAEYLMLKEASQNRTQNIQQQNAINRFPSLSNAGAGGNGNNTGKLTDSEKLNNFFGGQQVQVFAGTN